ncbi:MAG TPA: hypothetical protein VK716_15025 [Terracidiphilus sp.]|jgi:hypothetical protein|nr:hypothetical protein [Terracidiphilus sp.]
MELFLNSLWAALAIVCFSQWFLAKQGDSARRSTFVATAMLIVLLFPVISVSDDLWSLQNPAETDTCVRRLQSPPIQPTFRSLAGIPEPFKVESAEALQLLRTPLFCFLPVADPPSHDALQNRPPPSV